jgi:hypothetical protein
MLSPVATNQSEEAARKTTAWNLLSSESGFLVEGCFRERMTLNLYGEVPPGLVWTVSPKEGLA